MGRDGPCRREETGENGQDQPQQEGRAADAGTLTKKQGTEGGGRRESWRKRGRTGRRGTGRKRKTGWERGDEQSRSLEQLQLRLLLRGIAVDSTCQTPANKYALSQLRTGPALRLTVDGGEDRKGQQERDRRRVQAAGDGTPAALRYAPACPFFWAHIDARGHERTRPRSTSWRAWRRCRATPGVCCSWRRRCRRP